MDKDVAWLLKEKYHSHECDEFYTDVKRLQNGEPLAYVIGWVDFLGTRIDLSHHPLIPRPETEWWVEQKILAIQQTTSDRLHILDLCSGSGCIGIALLKHLPNARVTFGEIDAQLCTAIEKNLERNHIDAARAKITKTNLYENIREKFNFIFVNPPYIDPSKTDTVESSVYRFEPHLALFAERGVSIIESLIETSQKFLLPKGSVYVEFGKGQTQLLEDCAIRAGWNCTIDNDQYGVPRVLTLTKK